MIQIVKCLKELVGFFKGLLRWQIICLCWDWIAAEVIAKEHKIDFIADPSLLFDVDHWEPFADELSRGTKTDVSEDVSEGNAKFTAVHSAFASFGVIFLSVEALNRHFPEVVLSAEVCEFIVADGAIVVAIVAEHILCDVFELIGVLFKESDEGSLDFYLIELSVFIRVVNFQ